jgi:hypothetical protein
VEVHRHAEPSAFEGDEAEDIILQGPVIADARGVHFFGVGFRGIPDDKRAQIRHLEFFGDRAGFPVPV